MKTRRPKRSCTTLPLGKQRNPILTRSVMDDVTASERRREKAKLYRMKLKKAKTNQANPNPQVQSVGESTILSNHTTSDIDSEISEYDRNNLISQNKLQIEWDQKNCNLPKTATGIETPMPKKNTSSAISSHKTNIQNLSSVIKRNFETYEAKASDLEKMNGLKRKVINGPGRDRENSSKTNHALKNHKLSASEAANIKNAPVTLGVTNQPLDSICSRILAPNEYKKLKNAYSIEKTVSDSLPLDNVETSPSHQKFKAHPGNQRITAFPGNDTSHETPYMQGQEMLKAPYKAFPKYDKSYDYSELPGQHGKGANFVGAGSTTARYQSANNPITTQFLLADNQGGIKTTQNSFNQTDTRAVTSLVEKSGHQTKMPVTDATSRIIEWTKTGPQSREIPSTQKNIDNETDSRSLRNIRVTDASAGLRPVPFRRVKCPICKQMIDSFTIEFHASHCGTKTSILNKTSDEKHKLNTKKYNATQEGNCILSERKMSSTEKISQEQSSKINSHDQKRLGKTNGNICMSPSLENISTTNEEQIPILGTSEIALKSSHVKMNPSQTSPITQTYVSNRMAGIVEVNDIGKNSSLKTSTTKVVNGMSDMRSNMLSDEKPKSSQNNVNIKASPQYNKLLDSPERTTSVARSLDQVQTSTVKIFPETQSIIMYSTSLDDLKTKLPQDSQLNIEATAMNNLATEKKKLSGRFKHSNKPIGPKELRGETFLEALGIVSKQDILVQSAFPSIMQTDDSHRKVRKWYPDYKVSGDDIVSISLKRFASVNDVQVFIKTLKAAAKEALTAHQLIHKISATKTAQFPEPNFVIIEVLSWIQKARNGKISAFLFMKEVKKIICRLTDEIRKKNLERGRFLERKLSLLFDSFLPSHYALQNVVNKSESKIHESSLCVRTHTPILWDMNKDRKKKRKLAGSEIVSKNDFSSIEENSKNPIFYESNLSKDTISKPSTTTFALPKVGNQPKTKIAKPSETIAPIVLNQNMTDSRLESYHPKTSTSQSPFSNSYESPPPNQTQESSSNIANSPPQIISPSSSSKKVISNNDMKSTHKLNDASINRLNLETPQQGTKQKVIVKQSNLDSKDNRTQGSTGTSINYTKINGSNLGKDIDTKEKNDNNFNSFDSNTNAKNPYKVAVQKNINNSSITSKISKPKNAFTHFCRVVKPIIEQEIKSKYPSIPYQEVKRKVGDEAKLRWKALSNADRDVYRSRSKADYERYMRQLQN